MAHLAVFDVKALLAADAAFEDESLTCDVAKVSGIVTSLERNFSLDHGKNCHTIWSFSISSTNAQRFFLQVF